MKNIEFLFEFLFEIVKRKNVTESRENSIVCTRDLDLNLVKDVKWVTFDHF